MSFYKKYELQRLIHEFDAKVFRALQNSTGAQVLLHVFPATDSAREVVADAQRRIDGGGAIELIETGEFAGSMYVVTVPIEGIENLRAYLSSAKSAPLEPSPPKPVPVSAPTPVPVAAPTPVAADPLTPLPSVDPVTLPVGRPTPKPKRRTTQVIAHGPVTVNTNPNPSPGQEAVGEFTRLFGGEGGISAPPPQAAAKAAQPPPNKPPTAAPSASQPAPQEQQIGEFTRMFSPQEASPNIASPSHVAPPAPPVQQSPTASPPRARDHEMADFEKIFGPPGGNPFPGEESVKTGRPENPLPAWPQSPRANAAPAGEPAKDSDFTKFFGSAFHGAEIDIEQEHKRAVAEPQSDPRRPFQPASEFTRMFGTDDPAKHQPHPPVRLNERTHASTMFGLPKDLQQAAASLTGGTDSKAGPSEYTRLIGGAPGPTAPGAGLNEDSVSLKSGPMPPVGAAAAAAQAPGQQPPPVAGGSKIFLYIAVAAIVLSLLTAMVLLLKSR